MKQFWDAIKYEISFKLAKQVLLGLQQSRGLHPSEYIFSCTMDKSTQFLLIMCIFFMLHAIVQINISCLGETSVVIYGRFLFLFFF